MDNDNTGTDPVEARLVDAGEWQVWCGDGLVDVDAECAAEALQRAKGGRREYSENH